MNFPTTHGIPVPRSWRGLERITGSKIIPVRESGRVWGYVLGSGVGITLSDPEATKYPSN